ncbi:unnamed protein product [Caenorhabditis angaria]|uniref:Integrator complex subunit 11 n=1 Tax=Caenorhabditis angaria TaxID=860376 RepID=A0A9P1MWA3_9PELO|nr:unnamed protein product [Caenorhabditis angaria]
MYIWKCKKNDTSKNKSKFQVIIPVFALGRAQELCILLESYWERMALKIPIFFSQGLAERANQYYRLFISWTNENIKKTFVERNMFEFKHIRPMEKGAEDMPGPQVLFSTPGMLHGGQSLKVFKKWCSDPNNMIIMPGYCVAGTVGARVINGEKRIEIDGKMHDIRLGVEYMSFSAHADAKGIMQLIRQCQPQHVMFVHGEAAKMEFLKGKVVKEFKIPVHMPANGETVSIEKLPTFELPISQDKIEKCISLDPNPSKKQCPFNSKFVLDQSTQELEIEVNNEINLSEDNNMIPITVSLSQIIRGKKLNWKELSEEMQVHDPHLQLKQDGIEMFDGEICIMALRNLENSVELVWDECRQPWFQTIYQTICDSIRPRTHLNS